MAFPPAFLDELNARNPIEDVVGQYVALTRRGSNLFGLCPFHGEKTPSFSVAPEKGIFYCFGCHKGGGVVNFIMEIENLTYGDAVRFLAKRAGLEVPDDGAYQSQYKKKERLWALCRAAAQFYHAQLKTPAGEEARAYLQKRGVSGQTVTRFGLGYSPNRWTALLDVMTAKGYTKEELLEAGLLSQNRDKGTLYDRFRNRLMFPIRNIRGHVIAFSARTMIGEEPKYINTGDTPIFTKGSEVFGLYEARKSIQDKKRVIVVEGQMDVIQLSQAGFGEACAPLGTAIRAEHIERLLKMTDHVIFSFDGDAAGRKAAKRAMDLSLPLLDDAQKVSFVFLPEGEDPDSLVKKSGALAFEEMLKKALPLSSYLIEALSQGLDLAVLEEIGRAHV